MADFADARPPRPTRGATGASALPKSCAESTLRRLARATPGRGRRAAMSVFHAWAPKPPMGWNSWDCFATTVTEDQVKAQADYMATHLARFGWQYIVVDIQWYVPDARGFVYQEGANVALDAHGRFLPAANRFPSCAGGFGPLADYVHRAGLKFGVHLLRGIPRAAVAANLPILGSTSRARDIADPDDV